jgi:hypothetical protein
MFFVGGAIWHIEMFVFAFCSNVTFLGAILL